MLYHTTHKSLVDQILLDGLKPGMPSHFTTGGEWADEFYGARPIYLSFSPGQFRGPDSLILEVSIGINELVADLPSLVDTGAVLSEQADGTVLHWEDGMEPLQLSNCLTDGEILLDDLLSPGTYQVRAAIESTRSAVCLKRIPPHLISIYK